MNRLGRKGLVIPALVAAALWAGCDSDSGMLIPNQAPNTRISAGPPEAADTSFEVNLFWFGWDDDGFVDYYEIAWETPDDWEGPIFGNDSLFVVEASDTCCVDPLPDYPFPAPDSIYSQYHTFYVRAVDNNGAVDETPARVSFNAKTIAPYTEIVDPSPRELGLWGTEVEFNWVGADYDGLVVGYRYALSSLDDYIRDTGNPNPDAGQIIAWLDTLTYYPDFAGGYYTDSLVWRFTLEDSVLFANVTTTIPPNQMLFGVRAIDDAGAEEQILDRETNTRVFGVTRLLDGPVIALTSNILGNWNSVDPPATREAFAGQGIRFDWRARPGPSDAPVAGFSYAIDDTSVWEPFSLALTEFPEQPVGGDEELWFPDGGAHTFFLRAIDAARFVKVLAAQLRIFEGPRLCPAQDRYVLVVLDTNPESLINSDAVWPINYETVELGWVRDLFEGYNYQVYETRGITEPSLALLDCASSVFWFHSTDARSDTSILLQYHQDPPNPLPSYVASGGNLLLCGIQPLQAIRFFENVDTGQVLYQQNDPVSFQSTLNDTSLADHWMATQFGIAVIERTIRSLNQPPGDPDRLRVLRSQVRTGPNPYPDLMFDPLTWPNGPLLRGLLFYDRGIIPLDLGGAQSEVIYTANDTDDAIAVRRLTEPGVNGNVVYLGFHPYFVERPSFRQFVRAVLTDFGEFPSP